MHAKARADASPATTAVRERTPAKVRITSYNVCYTKLLRGKTDYDFFTEEHASAAFADEQLIIATGQPVIGIEEKETWPDGRTTWVSTTKMPLRDDEGKIMGIFGISRDITKHKKRELQMQAELQLAP